MRGALALTVWLLINFLFFLMCGYMYVQWRRQNAVHRHEQNAAPVVTTSQYDHEINVYNDQINTNNVHDVVLQPRFPKIERNRLPMDDAASKFVCQPNDTAANCSDRTNAYKTLLFTELHAVIFDESNIFRDSTHNRYAVKFRGQKRNYLQVPKHQMVCELGAIPMRTITRTDTGTAQLPFPERTFLQDDPKFYNSCALVSSAGALLGSGLGPDIDNHEAVVRFNDAPATDLYRTDIGTKTTHRILNSQVISKEEFGFLAAAKYRNITLFGWDASAYNVSDSVTDWLRHPDFNPLPNYVQYRERFSGTKFYLIHPNTVWRLWDFLQANIPYRVRYNPPSSGFLGLSILLHICDYVDFYEYVPSVKVSRKCHYYDLEENSGCTFGAWHPLAVEKLLTYHMNTANDYQVFQKGHIRIKGFRTLPNCHY